MSSLTNTQNLLINVFRPKYTYDTTSNFFQTRLDMSNIDTLTANAVVTFNAYVGDTNCNVYVGTGSGNSYLTPQSSLYNVAVGAFAGQFISNVSNSVFLGYSSGAGTLNSTDDVMIGANTSGNGSSNILIGSGTKLTGISSNNILIGPDITPATALCNTFQLGRSTGDITLSGDLLHHGIGIGLPQIRDIGFALDVSGYVHISNAGLGINADPRDHTLNVAGDMRVSDGYGTLALSNDGSLASTLNYGPATGANNATMTINGTLNVSNGLNVYGPVNLPNVTSLTVPGTLITSNIQSGGFYSTRGGADMLSGASMTIWSSPSSNSTGRLEINVKGVKVPFNNLTSDLSYWDFRTDGIFALQGGPLIRQLIHDVSGASVLGFVYYNSPGPLVPYNLILSNTSAVELLMSWNVTFYPCA
jgi:hypothetical protein